MTRWPLLLVSVLLTPVLAPAQIDKEARASYGVIPTLIRDLIQAEFTGFSLPSENDLSGPWNVYQSRYSWLPYLASGDYNDDGLVDYATLLYTKSEWMLVLFERQGDTYKPVTLQKGECPGNGLYRYPKAIAIRTIKKGQSYAPSQDGGDTLMPYTTKRDSLEFQDLNRGTTLLQYVNGRYADFLWDRSPFSDFRAGS